MSVAEYFDSMNYGPAPESDTEVRVWLAAHNASFGHFINGAFVPPAKQFETGEPATGKFLAKLADGSVADIEAAVTAARANPGPARFTGEIESHAETLRARFPGLPSP